MTADNMELQCILGGDKKNPSFTVARSRLEDDTNIYVFFGMSLLEIVPDDKQNPSYKLLIARLYNAGFKSTSITKSFGIARTTMKRWGEALKSGDPEKLIQALSGQGARKKMTKEICAYIKIRFPLVYENTRYKYSKMILEEIEEIFNVKLSSETIRPLLSDLKMKVKEDAFDLASHSQSIEEAEAENKDSINQETTDEDFDIPAQVINESNGCDLVKSSNDVLEEEESLNGQLALSRSKSAIDEGKEHTSVNPSNSINLNFVMRSDPVFCHHLGLLIFNKSIDKFSRDVGGPFITQLLVMILLGMKNIEQTKLLDFDAIKALFGNQVIDGLRPQRLELGKIATEKNIIKLFRHNSKLVNLAQQSDFYFDPHTEHYTGEKKILKGWCSNLKFADKIINMDFLHTTNGFPVYLSEADNYDDIRVRFKYIVKQFRAICEVPKEKAYTFVIDRGIYSMDLFNKIIKEDNLHIITWEKNYLKGQFNQEIEQIDSDNLFILTRCRNNSADILTYQFKYFSQDWKKNSSMKQIIVYATNSKKRTVEVSILTDDKERPEREVIELMFKRWIQENDFKYLDRHFGINEITSYDSTSYKDIKNLLEDKQVKTGEYKAIEKNEKMEKKKIKDVLFKKKCHDDSIELNDLSAQLNTVNKSIGLIDKDKDQESFKNKSNLRKMLLKKKIKEDEKTNKITNEIYVINERLEKIKKQKELVKKEGSKIEELIKSRYVKLDTRKKHFMDVMKIIARNIFYLTFEPFKERYDNFRDDHVYFRNLTQCHGSIYFGHKEVGVSLFPTAKYQPKMKKIITSILNDINMDAPKLSDGSNRVVHIALAEKRSNYL